MNEQQQPQQQQRKPVVMCPFTGRCNPACSLFVWIDDTQGGCSMKVMVEYQMLILKELRILNNSLDEEELPNATKH